MPLKLDDTLYFSSIGYNGYSNAFWDDVYKSTGEGGRFAIDLGKRINPNRHVSRNESIWTMPWPQEIIPKYQLETYDPTYTADFSDTTDAVAQGFRKRIVEKNEKFAIMYSGGIDSTIMVIALLRNLGIEELKNITLATNMSAAVENPDFWRKHVYGKFNLIDSTTHKYDDTIRLGYTPITGDDGDCIFGTMFGLNLYHNWEALAFANDFSEESRNNIRQLMPSFNDPGVHFSNFKDILIAYCGTKNTQPGFGRRMYEKFALNVMTAGAPVYSLHDFFWWLIFNVKMLNCGVRGAIYYNDTLDQETAIHRIENWYNDPLYQQWAMNNNGNGTKIGHSAATYKQAGRDYIYEFDRNPWYRTFKLKLESMGNVSLGQRVDHTSPFGTPGSRFGLTKDYELLSIDSPDVQDYIRHHLANFTIDWCE